MWAGTLLIICLEDLDLVIGGEGGLKSAFLPHPFQF